MSDVKLDGNFRSEDLEPVAAHCIGRWFADCEEAKATGDKTALLNACETMWYGMDALNKLSCCTKGAVHFSLACSNEVGRVADYIEQVTGQRPERATWGG